jgi:hypothetical protein
MTVLPGSLAWAVAEGNRASCLIVRPERPKSNQFVSGALSGEIPVLQTPPSDRFDPDVDRTKRNAQFHCIDQVYRPAQGDFHLPVGTPDGNPSKPKALHVSDDPGQEALSFQVALDGEPLDCQGPTPLLQG